jgi:predicted DNA-binding transcriptional regulator YafY
VAFHLWHVSVVGYRRTDIHPKREGIQSPDRFVPDSRCQEWGRPHGENSYYCDVMHKASRLFEIVRLLRTATAPVTAARMASALGVVERSIYRDMEALKVMGVPVEGGRGIGYVLRRSFELPPLMFSLEETEAIVLALGLLQRTGDDDLKRSADRVRARLTAAVPPPLRQAFERPHVFAWGTEALQPDGVDIATVRRCIRDERKLNLRYTDAEARETDRLVKPIALIYYAATINLVAWCELRRDIRRFRADRIIEANPADASFTGEGDSLRRAWIAGWETAAIPTSGR